MTIGASLFLLALGAILTWGVEFNASGVNIDVIGLILMAVGTVGLLLSLLFWSSFAPFGRRREVVSEEVHMPPGPHSHG